MPMPSSTLRFLGIGLAFLAGAFPLLPGSAFARDGFGSLAIPQVQAQASFGAGSWNRQSRVNPENRIVSVDATTQVYSLMAKWERPEFKFTPYGRFVRGDISGGEVSMGLDEFWAQTSLGPGILASAGKKRFNWASAYFFKPASYAEVQYKPWESSRSGFRESGRWEASMAWFPGAMDWEAVFLPIWDPEAGEWEPVGYDGALKWAFPLKRSDIAFTLSVSTETGPRIGLIHSSTVAQSLTAFSETSLLSGRQSRMHKVAMGTRADTLFTSDPYDFPEERSVFLENSMGLRWSIGAFYSLVFEYDYHGGNLEKDQWRRLMAHLDFVDSREAPTPPALLDGQRGWVAESVFRRRHYLLLRLGKESGNIRPEAIAYAQPEDGSYYWETSLRFAWRRTSFSATVSGFQGRESSDFGSLPDLKYQATGKLIYDF